ncbi:hypothetical protein BN1044_02232 [Hafnia alvei]|uniref:Uncharacterized protein n=1 Tax=Hafnia alvei TaxID=569 RepID=A0A1C6Z137_HAFAL|nr:hypothetical protein BN1044_02232 [Hafnia alvei]
MRAGIPLPVCHNLYFKAECFADTAQIARRIERKEGSYCLVDGV